MCFFLYDHCYKLGSRQLAYKIPSISILLHRALELVQLDGKRWTEN